jgi:hypothetical protein
VNKGLAGLVGRGGFIDRFAPSLPPK